MPRSPSIHTNHSQYTLATVHSEEAAYSDDERAALLQPSANHDRSYGSAPVSPGVPPNSRRLVFNAALKMGLIFFISTAFLGGVLWLALPTLEEDDRPMLRVPKSFAQLQDLNHLLKKYRDIYPFRIVVCYVITYLFLQAFSLPGSMYLSILGGAVWGVARALPLACACVATGATLCYFISAALGPALLTLPKFQSRLDTWTQKIRAQRANLIPFLIVLRIAPLPPHWVVNVICPHVGIGIIPFWISTFLGIFGVTVIHTTIGSGLDEMTSADDFHLISWRNFFGLSAVVIGVMIPVGIRYIFSRETASIATVQQVDDAAAAAADAVEGDVVLARGPSESAKPKTTGSVPTGQLVVLSDEESDGDFLGDSDDESDNGDIILEAGPALVTKPKDPAEGTDQDTVIPPISRASSSSPRRGHIQHQDTQPLL